ncbi:hypothetical protein BEP19_10700 [Ammoniphilus oxalaticus]|uniref:Uncharacterized protein n=1 Tax=Ammoniphilus oxalaticus TaxID=66863 RepID=A0A419SG05_9BACL|nr:hypothetical protein BEP19_10700 [Ammoniphilus oxalaticus]
MRNKGFDYNGSSQVLEGTDRVFLSHKSLKCCFMVGIFRSRNKGMDQVGKGARWFKCKALVGAS